MGLVVPGGSLLVEGQLGLDAIKILLADQRRNGRDQRPRVAGKLVHFYTLRAPSLVRDRDLEPPCWYLFLPIRRKTNGLAAWVVSKRPGEY
jgi:hypothetical protein